MAVQHLKCRSDEGQGKFMQTQGDCASSTHGVQIQKPEMFSLRRHLTCTQLTRMGKRTLTLLFGSARMKSKTETTTSLSSWILCLGGLWLADYSLCFKGEHTPFVSCFKPDTELKLVLLPFSSQILRDTGEISSGVPAVIADLWLWLGGRGRPDRRDSHRPGEPILQPTQRHLWNPYRVQPVSLGARLPSAPCVCEPKERNWFWVISLLGSFR